MKLFGVTCGLLIFQLINGLLNKRGPSSFDEESDEDSYESYEEVEQEAHLSISGRDYRQGTSK